MRIQFKWWYCLIYGLSLIIDGLFTILTIGYYCPTLCLKVALFGANKKIYSDTKDKNQ